MKSLARHILVLCLILPCAWMTALAGDPPAGSGLDEGDRFSDEAGALVPLEEGLVNVEVLGIAAQDFVAQYANDTLYLPFLALCDFLRIPADVSSDNATLTGELPPGSRFELSRRKGVAIRNGIESALPEGVVRTVGGELFIEQGFFFRLLAIHSTFKLSKLTLTISADRRLPLVQWSSNQQRYASLGDRERGEAVMADAISVERSLLGSPIIDWTYGNNLKLGAGRSNASVHLGGEFLYGELELDAAGAMPHAPGSRPTIRLDSWSWRYQAPESKLLSRITLGVLPLAETQLYALDLSNVPLTPRGGFTEHAITGQTQPGWTIELYEGSHLVDVTRADPLGYYSFDVPVGYGTVDRTLRFLGNYGEVLTERRRIQLDSRLIPAGEVDYSLRAGTDRLDAGGRFAGAGRLEVGVASRLTLGADAELRPTLPGALDRDSLSSSAFATLWLGESSSLGLRYRPEAALLSGEFYTINSWNWMVRAGVDSLSLENRTFVSTLSTTIPAGMISFGGSGRLERRVGGYRVSAIPQISGYVAGINCVASTEFSAPLGSDVGSDSGDTLLTRRSITSSLKLLATPFKGLLLGIEGSYDHLNRKVVEWQMSSYVRIGNGIGVSLGYAVPGIDWRHGMVSAQLELGIAPARIFAFANRDASVPGSEMSGTMLAQGSMVVSGGGVSFSPDYSLGKSMVLVRAFRDDNGNGVRDGDEPDLPAPQAQMHQGRMEINGEDGAFTLLPPNMLWTLTVDRYGYAADGLFPSRYRFGIFTAPSAVLTIDVPYEPGFDVTGHCSVGEGEGRGRLNGLRIQLTSSANSALYDGEVFSDGTIYFTGVAAGDYKLVIDSSQLAARHLALAGDPGTIHLDRDATRLPSIRLVKKEDEGR